MTYIAKQKMSSEYHARGSYLNRVRSVIFLLPAWFSFHKGLRVFFHRLRGVRIGKKVEIGYFCIIGNVHPENIFIDDEAVITAGSVLLEHDNALYYTFGKSVKYGKVSIGKKAFIGLKSIIMPGVSVGPQAIVAPFSFVTEDVPPRTLVAGQPAVIKKHYQ